MYQKKIISSLTEDFMRLDTVYFVSDGCAARFKNRFTLSNLFFLEEDFGVTGKWHFFQLLIQKVLQMVGGTFKRSVYNRCLSGQYSVYNAKDFVN